MKKYILIFLSIFFFVTITTKTKADTMNVQVVADTMINQASPDDKYGAAWYGAIQNGTHQNICTIMKFDNINLPPEGILDTAFLHIYYFYTHYNNVTTIQIGPNHNDKLLNTETERNISWNNRPGFIVTNNRLVFYRFSATPYEMKSINITKIVKAWLEGELQDNGIYICVAPNQQQTYMRFYTRETSDTSKRPYLEVTYHAAVLGDPAYDPGTDSDMSFELLTPDGDTLSTPPYTFTWEDPAASDPAREHLTIILNKVNSDDSRAQIFKQDIPITWTRFESSIPLDDGHYEWYIEAYLMDHKLFTTEKNTFTVDHSASSEGSSTETSEDTDESEESTEEDENATENGHEEQTENETTEEQDNERVNHKTSKSWKILGFSISVSQKDIIWSILAISIFANIGLAYYLFGKKKDKDKKEVASQDKSTSGIKVETKEEKKAS